eukprot:5370077-Pleurochrysis_carterae.AAC.1
MAIELAQSRLNGARRWRGYLRCEQRARIPKHVFRRIGGSGLLADDTITTTTDMLMARSSPALFP